MVVALDSYKNNMKTFIAQLGFASLCTCYGFRLHTLALGGPGNPFGSLLHLAFSLHLVLCSVVTSLQLLLCFLVFFEEENCFPVLMSFDMGKR